ncbi:MAG TPA: exonuclease SbcCD subunit D [Anaerolineae bacterium]|nr:exonuclease SbcCD subunit D [Anaerolineae bacterium]HNU05754.1 exonuclease SbcCD subunit D [Anaerolineae bacterium]
MTTLPIRLLHIADIHIGMENYGRTDPQTGLNGRVMDFLRRLSDAVDYALDHEIDIVIFAGDAYKTRDPNPTFQREFARRMKRLADAGIPVVMLVGNHDLPAVAQRATSIGIFSTLAVPNTFLGNREKLWQITCRRGQPVQVATVPYPLKSGLLTDEESRGKSIAEVDALMQQTLAENIRALAGEARQQPDIPALLTGHFTVQEASTGSERSIMIGRDVAVARSVLADPAWDYVALGHIHKHQSLNGDAHPPVIYSGSIERIDFGEEREPKGWVVATIQRGRADWQFVAHYRRPARPFITIAVDLRGEEGDPTPAVLAAIAQRELTDAVVRVNLRLRAEQETLLQEREVLAALHGAAYFVAGFNKDVERPERQRLGAVSVESLAPRELLARYFEVTEVSPQRSARLLQAAEELMAEPT